MSLLATETSKPVADALTAAEELQALSDALHLASETDSMLLDETTEVMARMISERAKVVRIALHNNSE